MIYKLITALALVGGTTAQNLDERLYALQTKLDEHLPNDKINASVRRRHSHN